MSIGSKIKKIRTLRKMTQEDLADQLDIHVQTVSSYERDKRLPSRTALVKLCQVLNVSSDYLLSEEDSFVIEAQDQYGYRGRKKAESFIQETALLFAGGELSEEDRDKVFAAVMEIYWRSKKINEKYTPKKYREMGIKWL